MTERTHFQRLSIAALTLFGLLVFALGCNFSARPGYNDEDLKQAQAFADKYFNELKARNYQAVVDLSGPELKAQVTAEDIKRDVEDRFGGEVIESWQFQEHELFRVPTTRISLVYVVNSANFHKTFRLMTELVANPWHWQIIEATILNDQAETEHADQSKLVAEKFLARIGAHDFKKAYELFSPEGKKVTSPEHLAASYATFEQSSGLITGWDLKQFWDTTVLTGDKREPFTILVYQLRCTKKSAPMSITMRKTPAGWQIEAVHT